MNVLLDTSVFVAAMIEAHPAHPRAFPWLQHLIHGTHTGFVAAHSIAELYAILTALPVHPRISPSAAQQLIQHNVLDVCTVISLSDADYAAIIHHLSDQDIVGGVTYDALIVYAASKAKVDLLLTLNEKDFRRIYPDYADKIVAP
jgi:predicted nucleic acid-binding protein